MAKGKHATLSVKRQLAGARDHLSAITDELAELKVRTRDAEARAFSAEQRAKNAERQIQSDAALVEQCRDLIDDHRRRKRARRAEWENGAKDDFGKLLCDLPVPTTLGRADSVEFLGRRYPKLFRYLGREDFPHVHRERNMKGLSEERVRQLGRAMGERLPIRWDPDRDAADVANDLMDMRQMDLTREEMIELLGANDEVKK